MGIVTICIVNGKISTHPHIYKILFNKILKKRNIAVFIQLNGECDNKFSCQSAVFGLFVFFHSIPELFPVIPFRWSHWRKHHFLIDQTLLSGIVMLNAIIIIVHAATAHISRSSNSRPTGTTADDFGLHMINCHIWYLLSMLSATVDKALGRAHEPRRGYHCLIYQVVSKCALRE